ncbi:ArsR/SmtB family transcription factor [Loigolactobacillus backii]|uniref:Transcriptional regulator n=1 Tax=Loigolactobacillus backii TaxID=375175 RepID=A0A192GZC9_9LACO|nr:metalloregulator ArsR/SmtB family transcription factor [Loigolactobacillus backii]ANK61445.1 transcriptional regulator [Loigolactobacillus backii]ANK69356.1 transcriptional regulator [Loigolactobacillus backii]MDA5387786.1 metalloregulator ArsR/SmtB family transcription factor [Loigolactobacillus backii]MDA5390884.1 metalloregulator ArsR/SmtB family transcription factor [Loigolactobacillus backii]PIO84195.1 transcriptional regulator [Loigolactobacillus backii]
MDYQNYVQTLKAMADPKRLKIIDLLSCGSLCACDILEHFDFSQPTLSHHMKVLQNAGIVSARKEGKWQHYTLRPQFIETFKQNTDVLLNTSEHCVCDEEKCTGADSERKRVTNEKN